MTEQGMEKRWRERGRRGGKNEKSKGLFIQRHEGNYIPLPSSCTVKLVVTKGGGTPLVEVRKGMLPRWSWSIFMTATCVCVCV